MLKAVNVCAGAGAAEASTKTKANADTATILRNLIKFLLLSSAVMRNDDR
jgi:hypothetical protein